MRTTLFGMVLVFVLVLLTCVGGLVLLPPAWTPIFASVAGLSGLGLGITGYALRKQ